MAKARRGTLDKVSRVSDLIKGGTFKKRALKQVGLSYTTYEKHKHPADEAPDLVPVSSTPRTLDQVIKNVIFCNLSREDKLDLLALLI